MKKTSLSIFALVLFVLFFVGCTNTNMNNEFEDVMKYKHNNYVELLETQNEELFKKAIEQTETIIVLKDELDYTLKAFQNLDLEYQNAIACFCKELQEYYISWFKIYYEQKYDIMIPNPNFNEKQFFNDLEENRRLMVKNFFNNFKG